MLTELPKGRIIVLKKTAFETYCIRSLLVLSMSLAKSLTASLPKSSENRITYPLLASVATLKRGYYVLQEHSFSHMVTA